MEILLLLVAVLLGSVVQGALGFGLALVAVPALTLLRPEALPAVVLLLALPLATMMAVRERHAVDAPGLAYLLAGRLIGTFGGVGLLWLVPDAYLSVLFGGLLVLAALTSAVSPEVPLRDRTRFWGGTASGVMGTAAAIGGPPLALIYQSRSGPQVRATLAVSFVVGTLLSLLALALSGRVTSEHLLLAFALLPGLWSAHFVAKVLSESFILRPAILLFAAVSGAVAMLLGLVR